MKRKIMLMGTILICGFLLCGCGNSKLKNGEEVAFTINGENVTADSLYKNLKEKYGTSIMIDMIDKEILGTIYKDDEDIEKQVTNQIETLKTQYSDSWEDTLKNAGYDNENELKNDFRLSFQRNKAIEDYVKNNIKDDEINAYYKENTVGDISAKHILIKVDTEAENGLTDDEARKKAEEIIKKLDNGEDFSKLAKENSDDPGSKDNGGDLGYFNKGDMVKEFEEAAYKLKVNKYTKEPVKTSYGYHIILKTGEKDKPKLKDVKDNIIESITNQRLEEDATLQVTALDELRKSYNLKITDSKLKSEYKKYIKEALEKAKESNQN
ncbi:MAG: peptidylprolyl isomerase [Bacilli bacterium]|nr:peptidylprolyl isomerase [Bacilli bacterium]